MLLTVNLTVITDPVVNTNPGQDTTLAAVPAAVEHEPKCVIFDVPSNETPSIVLAVANFVADPAFPLTVVCAGCTWSLLDTVEAVPADAVPAALGALVPYVT